MLKMEEVSYSTYLGSQASGHTPAQEELQSSREGGLRRKSLHHWEKKKSELSPGHRSEHLI